jgi:rare lipoprotein A
MPAPILWLILSFVLAGCATGRGAVPSPPPSPPPRAVLPPRPSARPQPPRPTAPPSEDTQLSGQASWYGRVHQGKRTASGEKYDMHKLTAAHRTLPLGTRVLVTNVENGRTVEVRINDRGPFVDDRVLDLSYAAARQLGAVGDGVIQVTLKVVTRSAADDASERPPPPKD